MAFNIINIIDAKHPAPTVYSYVPVQVRLPAPRDPAQFSPRAVRNLALAAGSRLEASIERRQAQILRNRIFEKEAARLNSLYDVLCIINRQHHQRNDEARNTATQVVKNLPRINQIVNFEPYHIQSFVPREHLLFGCAKASAKASLLVRSALSMTPNEKFEKEDSCPEAIQIEIGELPMGSGKALKKGFRSACKDKLRKLQDKIKNFFA